MSRRRPVAIAVKPGALLAGMVASVVPGALHAQESAPPEVPRPRTGPNAEPQPLPGYVQPESLTLPPAPQAPSAPPVANQSRIITDVRISAEGEGIDAVPPPAWRPEEDAQSGLQLAHQPGEPLDADWAQRQFALNNLVGAAAPVDRHLALVQRINRAFLSAGFINSGLLVAPQTAPDVLELRLVYGGLVAGGDVSPLSVEWGAGGSQGLTSSYVARRLPSARRRPLSAIELEKDFRLLAEDPAIRTVSADLRPGSRPGEATLNLTVYPQDRFDFYLGVANNRSPSVGGERAYVGAYLRNLISGGDILTGEVGVTEGLEDGVLSYVTPFVTPRTSLFLRGSINDAAVTDSLLEPLDIRSKDRTGEIGITHKLIDVPLLPSAKAAKWLPARTLTTGVLLTHRWSRTFLLDEPFSFSPGSVNGRSEYTAVRLIGDYLVRDVRQVFAASLTGTLGLDGTRSDVPGIPNPKKNFKALLAQINYARRLSPNGLELRARLAGQLSDGFLYSGERFAVGGETTVRGYRENLILADEGLLGSVELSQPFSLTGGRRSSRGVDWGSFSISGFAEGATVRNSGDPQPSVKSIYSIGTSLAWTPSDAIIARISYGLPLKDIDQTGRKDIQDRGIHFRFTIYPLRWLRNRRS